MGDSTPREDHHARVTCLTTRGIFVMEFHRQWSPLGFDQAVGLFEKGFYDHSHIFRVIPNFLVQFGISYRTDLQDQPLIPDEPQLNPRIPFTLGTIAFAGSGVNSRDTHLFIALDPDDDPQWGKEEPWETPVGRVVEGFETVVRHFYSYGDDATLPEQNSIYEDPNYIKENYPLTDKFETCGVERYRGLDYESYRQLQQKPQQREPLRAATLSSTKSGLMNRAEEVFEMINPHTNLLVCLGLVLFGVLTINYCFAPRKMAGKRN